MARELLRRACEAVRGLRGLVGEPCVLPHVTLVRDPARPEVWDANYACAVTAEGPGEIEQVLAACDGFFPPPIRHRRFFCDPLTPEAFVAHLVWAGYEGDATLQMLLEGPLRGPTPAPVEIRIAESERDWESHACLVRDELADRSEREGSEPYTPEVSRGLAELRRAMAPEVRVFLARCEGVDCGTFAAWPGREGLGVVEWLFTQPRFRRRGIARALVAHAVTDARARGAGPVLIGPQAGGYDVPRRFYAALGFRPLCVTRAYLRRPPPA